jgi:hypothetical protein
MTSDPATAETRLPIAASSPPTARSWLGNAWTAAELVADHPELWLPGALAALAFLGWLPFVLAVAPLPTVGDLGFFVSSVVLSPSFPLNAILLGGGAALLVICASVVVATGEAALIRGVEEMRGGQPSRRTLDDDAVRAWLIGLVAAVPALAALAVVGLAMAAVGPAEYQSPDLGTPLALRIIADVWLPIAALVVLTVLGQAFAGGAQRASIAGGQRLAAALAAGAMDVIRHPIRRLATGIGTALALAVWLGLCWALLHVLWAPLDRAVGQGALLEGANPLLLVAFIAIWLCLVAGGGALAAWSSAWWSLEQAGRWS